MLIEMLYEKEVPIQELHGRVREGIGKRCSIEHLCLSILGARDLKAHLLAYIVEALELNREEKAALGCAFLGMTDYEASQRNRAV